MDYIMKHGLNNFQFSPFGSLPESSGVILTFAVFSLVAALLLVSLLDGVKIVTFPVTIAVFFAAALYVHRLTADIHPEGMTEFQRLVCVSTISQACAALLLIMIFKARRLRGP